MFKRLRFLYLLLFASLVAAAWAVNVSGEWRVTISTADGEIKGFGALQQSGNKVTGWVGPSKDDPIPVDGTLNGNKLTLNTHPQPGRNVAFATCEVRVRGNKMAGTIDKDKGKITLVRTP